MDQDTESQINPQLLGVTLQQKRELCGFTQEQAASLISVSLDTYEDYEAGGSTPSLPELETLSYYFDLLPETFWIGHHFVDSKNIVKSKINFQQIARIRQKTIGLLTRQFRMEAGLTSQQVATQIQLGQTEIEKYELGEEPIPIDHLERIASLTNRSLNDFLDRKSPVGVWAERQRTDRELMDLPDNIREFVSKPINRPFIELAMRLSTMPVKQLREIAEGILEITL